MIKLLVVEDEMALQHAMVAGLKTLGYLVDGAGDGIEALNMFNQETYDLVILDLNLPHIDGLDLLVSFKEINQSIKVIILSARSEVEDKVQGFKLGTSDYLTKPFHFDELIARIQSLLLRDFVQYTSEIEYKDYHVFPLKQEVHFNSEQLDLTLSEYLVLEWLVKHKNDVMDYEKTKQLFNVETLEHSRMMMDQLINKLPVKIIHNKQGIGYYV